MKNIKKLDNTLSKLFNNEGQCFTCGKITKVTFHKTEGGLKIYLCKKCKLAYYNVKKKK